jgi:hypothetical protein
VVDIQTRRQKQQALITELLERKIRLHARQLYDQGGQVEGFALRDWYQAESEVLDKNVLASLYRKIRAEGGSSDQFEAASDSQLTAAE